MDLDLACGVRRNPVVQLFSINADEVETIDVGLVYSKQKRLLILGAASSDKPLLNLVVLDATMPYAGWVRFTLEAPAMTDPTICYQPTPYGFELQDEICGVEEL